jgi:hypothetical protein
VQCSKVAPSAALRSCSICKTSASCRSTLSRFLLSLCRALACSTSTKRTQSRRPNIASLPHCTARKAVDLNNHTTGAVLTRTLRAALHSKVSLRRAVAAV